MATTVDASDRLRHVFVAVAVGLAGLIVGGVLTSLGIVLLNAAGVSTGPSVFVVVSLLLTQGVGFGGVAIAYLRYRDLPLEFVNARLPALRGWIWAGAGYVLALIAAVSAGLIALAAGAPQTQNQVAELAFEEPSILLIMIPGSFLLVGPGEELLFRGIVQGTLREVFGPVGAITLASVVFASVHAVALTGGPAARLVGVTVLFFPSIVLGVAYERTGNIVVPSLIHGAYNATVFAILYASIQLGAAP